MQTGQGKAGRHTQNRKARQTRLARPTKHTGEIKQDKQTRMTIQTTNETTRQHTNKLFASDLTGPQKDKITNKLADNASKLNEQTDKQLEKERDSLASERDKLLIDKQTIMSVYTEWLIDNNFILTGGMKIDHVAKFKKALNKLRRVGG